jgi:hypothetical protein
MEETFLNERIIENLIKEGKSLAFYITVNKLKP